MTDIFTAAQLNNPEKVLMPEPRIVYPAPIVPSLGNTLVYEEAYAALQEGESLEALGIMQGGTLVETEHWADSLADILFTGYSARIQQNRRTW